MRVLNSVRKAIGYVIVVPLNFLILFIAWLVTAIAVVFGVYDMKKLKTYYNSDKPPMPDILGD